MDYVKFFKDLFEFFSNYRNIVLLKNLIKNDVDFLQECGFLKSDIGRLSLEFKIIILEKNEENYSYVKKEKEYILERFLKK